MDLPIDDDVYRVDDWFLVGDIGRFRYRAVFLAVVVGAVTAVVVRALPIGDAVDWFAAWVSVTVGTTWWIMTHVTDDTSALNLAVTLLHEIRGPRRPAGIAGELSAARVLRR
jgi:hypothetical protein